MTPRQRLIQLGKLLAETQNHLAIHEARLLRELRRSPDAAEEITWNAEQMYLMVEHLSEAMTAKEEAQDAEVARLKAIYTGRTA